MAGQRVASCVAGEERPQAADLEALHCFDNRGRNLCQRSRRVDIRCFNLDPSVASSLKFLRRTPWARKKVEALYLETS